ncbi:hypothetical protein ACWEPB_02850 [Kitasatospora cineracea]
MSTLNWRTVAELRLTSALVPNPNSTSERLASLYNVNVAIEGSLVHIDPRQQPADRKQEFEVSVVPTSSVEYIRYTQAARSGTLVVN